MATAVLPQACVGLSRRRLRKQTENEQEHIFLRRVMEPGRRSRRSDAEVRNRRLALQLLPLFAGNAGLPQDAGEEVTADVRSVRIR